MEHDVPARLPRSRSYSCTRETIEFGSRANIEALYDTLPEPKQLVFVDGVEPFFYGKTDEMGAAIDAWLTERHPELAPAQI